MTEDVQEQLFADASTLLMFASAAARQSLPPETAAAEPGLAAARHPYPPALNPEQTAHSHAAAPPAGPPRGPRAPGRPLLQIPPLLRPSHTLPPYAPGGYAGPAASTLVPLRRPPQNVLPPLKPLAMARAAPPGFAYAPGPSGAAACPPPGPIMAHPGYGYYGLEAAPLPRIYGGPYPVPRRPSVAPSAEPAAPSGRPAGLRRAQSSSPPEPAHAELPARPQDTPGGTHKRTLSESSTRRPPATSPAASPGVGPYARGINVESGQRSADNAMIAAAALAAAADMPLPLKSKDGGARPALSVDTAALGPAPREGLAPKLAPDTDDENKTEDELASSAVHEAFGAAVLPPAVALRNARPEEKQAPAEARQGETQAANVPQEEKQAPAESRQGETQAPANAPLVEKQAPAHAPREEKQPPPPAVKPEPVPAGVPPPLASYKVDPDAGTIGCICGIDEDDGFTIQCDVCFRWQHCSCMGYLTNKEVPEDEYKCYYCDELKWNKIDPALCRAATIARLDMDKHNDVAEKPAPPKRKTLSSGNDDKKRRRLDKDARPPTEKPPIEKRKSLTAASPTLKPAPLFEIHNKDNPLLEDGATAEPFQSVYYRLKENDYKTPEVRSAITHVGPQFCETMSISQFKALKFSKVSLPNHQKFLQERNELRRSKGGNKTTVRMKSYSDNPKQKFVSVVKTGLFISENSAPATGEAVIPAGTVVIEYLGEIDSWDLHVNNKINQYPLWGTLKPKVAKVRLSSSETDGVDLVVDSRFVGNEARFIRRSFLVVTTQAIHLKGENLEEELRLPWEWDPSHPINDMIRSNEDGTWEEGKRFEDFTEEEKAYLISCVDTILNFVECACNTSSINNQCAIFKVKKATSYLLRSNRKASSLGGSGAGKSKEELVLPKKVKEYVSWKRRLIDRDYVLLEESPYAESQLPSQNEAEDLLDLGVIDADAENTKDGVNVNGIRLFGKTFRKNFLEQTQLSFTSYHISSGASEPLGANSLVGEFSSDMLAIPLTSEVLAKIKSQVNEVFDPCPKIPSSEIPPNITLGEPVVVDKKPPVVKKLSFADYKKKKK
ncbi:hypothetical protein METBIDRAFT_76339 [Metschnikowia bicuspidata var. bicuspidata NRRL YB-4993]|uniref:Zinc finger PHD-type domain-containing protein n=1 Tax=Metschnikowia bicuspidata var. bicuspidata NRRL YB-4993 TaxID=869754 RepID=A0A1A0HH27_9ASCO|nr:hypothetical protein METBIDRAFT_76339 [Metschnikowia bicuspidata var. bicuspidata NRRL YB-4993]OBA23300.1 hypothetical protein METBIDRAFT_76339 [Metschnikowia bicuspidata var. bicuspidata NRRL YB-4993]